MGKVDFEQITEVKEKLVGTWKLVDYHRILASGEIVYPWGNKIDGRLTYTTDGQLSVQHRSSHPAFRQYFQQDGGGDPVKSWFQPFIRQSLIVLSRLPLASIFPSD